MAPEMNDGGTHPGRRPAPPVAADVADAAAEGMPAAAPGADAGATERGADADVETPLVPGTEGVDETDGTDIDSNTSNTPPAHLSPPEPDPAPAPDTPADDPRVAAVRRVGAAGRRWRAVQLGACAALLAVAMTAGAVAVGALRDGGGRAVATSAAVSPGLLAGGDLDAGVTSLQAHLRTQPRDFGSWATLGLAYVEQARTQGDPSRYPQARKAFDTSLSLRADNDQALAGLAALAAARHDFRGALTDADRALERNPYNERAMCTRIDALVELGRYAEASKAAGTADARRPGIPVFTRYAYVHELRGDVTTARRVLTQALDAATGPGDIAYVATQLGQLAWNQGDYPTALAHYARALAADDGYLPALEGRARAQAASGRREEAVKGLEAVVARYPLPGPLVALGELYEARGAAGDAARARDQYALVDAWTALARANGVDVDLDTALAAADHGDRAAALRAARAEWARRHTVHTADALAWALHVNGRDAEALGYARQATATGYRNAGFLYHLGMIERATGHSAEARTHLTAALELNPGFSPLGARTARSTLTALTALTAPPAHTAPRTTEGGR
ncbi:tetratricopeptide repeat protein [Streptomyces longwoodensis]|uniref:tetratricopeptide repeat protein n=1 Tax=Streptomyces longwoodensis TaxID=68231 RepID=UPI003827F1CB